MQRSGLVWNLNLEKEVLKDNKFDALVLFYLLKAIHTNSIIYSTDTNLLFRRLKTTKIIPRTFTENYFNSLIDYLYKKQLIFIDAYGHLVLKKVRTERGWYKSVIRFNKDRIKWVGMKSLLTKEHILHNKYRQEKVIQYRKDLTTNLKKEQKPIRRVRISEKISRTGASYSNSIVFSFRGLSKELGVSISEAHKLVVILCRFNHLKIRTVKETLHKVGCDLDIIENLISERGYLYVNKNGYLVRVLGSEILSYSIR